MEKACVLSGVKPAVDAAEYRAPQSKIVRVEFCPLLCQSGGEGDFNLPGGGNGGED